MTVAAFQALGKVGSRGGILEANMSQTIGSASSSLASGVIFTLPALFLWDLQPTLLQMTLLTLCGGLVGVLLMIPLRFFLIEREHGRLPYPEGIACAKVLIASDAGGNRARNVFVGLGMGAFFKFVYGWVQILPDELHLRLPFIKKGQVGMEMSAALFGVGYILGPRIATIMVSGTLLSSVLIIPTIAWWGEGREFPLYPETVRTIAQMSTGEIWNRYVRYIGAGAVATGGFITLLKTFPVLLESFRVGVHRFTQSLTAKTARLPRTGQDLPLRFVLLGVLVIVAVMTAVPYVFGPTSTLPIRLVGALVMMVAAFFFVTVSSRIVGLVGVTSNPTSGMTIATLMVTSFIFLGAGWTDEVGRATVLTIGCVVAIAASIAGDTSQDLKTGFLLGATPYRQQLGELLGVLTSATFVCLAVLLLAGAYGFGSDELPAPQATLMKLVIDGVLQNSLPWTLVAIGVAISLLAEAVHIPSLPFAVGVYLPETTMPTVFLGGLLRIGMERRAPSTQEATTHREEGILFGSGLVGGEGLMGVAIAAYAFIQGTSPPEIGYSWAGSVAHVLAAIAFGFLVLLFVRSCKKPVN